MHHSNCIFQILLLKKIHNILEILDILNHIYHIICQSYSIPVMPPLVATPSSSFSVLITREESTPFTSDIQRTERTNCWPRQDSNPGHLTYFLGSWYLFSLPYLSLSILSFTLLTLLFVIPPLTFRHLAPQRPAVKKQFQLLQMENNKTRNFIKLCVSFSVGISWFIYIIYSASKKSKEISPLMVLREMWAENFPREHAQCILSKFSKGFFYLFFFHWVSSCFYPPNSPCALLWGCYAPFSGLLKSYPAQ